MSLTVRALNAGEPWQPLPPYSAHAIAGHRPDVTLLAGDPGAPRAHASLWWHGVGHVGGYQAGAIGHYGATDDTAAAAVLAEAVRRLGDQGCEAIVGPMDGTTWRRYRFVLDPPPGVAAEPPFFMEPENPPDYVRQFRSAGFDLLTMYYSSIDRTLEGDDPAVDAALPKLRDRGIVLRDIHVDRFEQELRRVHALSLEAFARNYLYSPISEAEFVGSYAAARELVRPGMVLMAEEQATGDLVGFMFALPDIRNPASRTAIAKTVAVKPGFDGLGLGGTLIELSRRAARGHGFQRLIYALMHQDNRSTRIAGRFGEIFREYALFAHRGRT